MLPLRSSSFLLAVFSLFRTVAAAFPEPRHTSIRPALSTASSPPPPHERPWLAPGPIPGRVASLLAAMTPDEKAMQLVYECAGNLFAGYNASGWGATGIGTVGIECSGYPAGATMAERIAALRAFQQGAIAQTRLGIPITFAIETSHCGAAGGTIFPMGATQGATWNASLVGDVARAIAAEARAWGGDRGLSPEINVVTDPRFGRLEENFGEEALLVARMATAAVLGLQGAGAPTEYLLDPTASIVAEAKHALGYGISGLDGGAADVSDKTLHDVFLKPWRAFIRAGGRGMMAAHNDLNGLPMHANPVIFQQLFRGEWNYTGFVGSDYGNIGALTNTHLAANVTSAASLALAGGVDQAFCDGSFYPGVLVPGMASGAVSRVDVDRAVTNVLTAKFAAGLFDGALPDPARAASIYTPSHRTLARRVASEGAVLLKNDGVLPLDVAGKVRRVAVIGPNAGCASTSGGGSGTSGVCTPTAGLDCNGNDLEKVDGVATPAACCALCAASPSCAIAVLATDQNQCLLKSSCAARSPNAARVLCDPGKPPPPPTPWTCDAMRGMLGGYSNLERQEDALADNHAHVVTVLEAAQAAAAASGGRYNVSWAPGCAQRGSDTSGIAPAAALAAAADVAVVVLGDGGESIGYDSSVSCGEGADRPSLDLPGVQLQLLAAVLATGTPTVVVVTHGRPFTFGAADYGGSVGVSAFGVPTLDARAGAVLAAWRPGCEGGSAVWDLLTGVVSPSGRLAQSWPTTVGAVRVPGISPAYIKLTVQGGRGWTLGASFAPAFPLGHGLDYLAVTLGASSATVDAAALAVHVAVTLTNAAPRTGGFVVQAYFTQALSRWTRYERQLGGWAKVAVPASGSVDVAFDIAFADMAYWDPVAHDMVLEAGDYTIRVCTSIAACDDAHAHVVNVPAQVNGL